MNILETFRGKLELLDGNILSQPYHIFLNISGENQKIEIKQPILFGIYQKMSNKTH